MTDIEKTPPECRDQLFEIVTYLASSAALSLDETPSLAAFRMVDAASRIVPLLTGGSDDATTTFLEHIEQDLRDHLNLVMTDQPAFDAWLSELASAFATEARRRAQLGK